MLLAPLASLVAMPQPLSGTHKAVQGIGAGLGHTTLQHTGYHGMLCEEIALQNLRGECEGM